jgi:UDP-glucose 4-epimerase
MNIIVSGGAGFIGSHVTDYLLSQGHHVIVVDNLLTGRAYNLRQHPRLKFLHQDIATCSAGDFLKQSNQKIHGIVHLAAIPSVGESWQQPQKVNDNNCSSMLRVIELCEELNIPRLVFASSAAVYGDQHTMPISEKESKSPLSPYGLQKLVCEQYAKMFSEKFQYSCVVLRFFNVYGPRPSLNSPNSGVIDSFLKSFLDNLPIEIHGDGSQTRDFIFVTDVAESIRKALTIPLKSGTFEACNIGSGQATSLIQLVQHLQAFFPQWSNRVICKPSREGDIKNSQADISKAKYLLNFSPATSLATGLRKLVSAELAPLTTSFHEPIEMLAKQNTRE